MVDSITLNSAFLAVFIVIQIVDVWTTARGLAAGDEEAAPLGKLLFERLGFWPTVLLIKGTGVALAIAATLMLADAYWFTGPLCLIGMAVLVNNLAVLGAADE